MLQEDEYWEASNYLDIGHGVVKPGGGFRGNDREFLSTVGTPRRCRNVRLLSAI